MTAASSFAPHYTAPVDPQNFKRCACHPSAQRHRFGKTLACCRRGCEVNWHQYQINPVECGGGEVPADMRGKRDV